MDGIDCCIWVLIVKFGMDGYDWGVKVVVWVLCDVGMEVIYIGLCQIVDMIVNVVV